MAHPAAKTPKKDGAKFIPKMENYETSLAYEGMALKQEDRNKSIAELRRKYAR
ncbi:hypothetical protein P2G88_01240 [Aliiglaciecola sp. CAU 1673]|uniref:hypothetical protein n=1 Tax=Aliiglaciecola sp. CAU 1673 TaxID=3032595 RepID=UPI0023DBD750|nr:hypothetical protein [Aliiglaciecola sp. CAU 1673]MDF2176875.1 hypothetical protein [Aliiglaciecola sp. CAU 1673]